MLNDSKRSLSEKPSSQDISPGAAVKPGRRFPIVPVVLAGGLIIFVIWNLPNLMLMFASPAIFILFAFLFVLVIWGLGVNYGWWDFLYRGNSGEKQTGSLAAGEPAGKGWTLLKRKKQSPVSATYGGPHYPHARHKSAELLMKRRKRQFYTGRTYLGKIHQVELEQRIGTSLSGPLLHQDGTPAAVNTEPEEIDFSVPAAHEEPAPAAISPSMKLDAVQSGSPTYTTEPMPTTQLPVAINLLKELRVEVVNAEDERRPILLRRKRREDGRYTERELLAYMASWRGKPVGRDKLLESIFGYGLSEEKYSLTNLTNHFNKCTQFLRQDINKVAAELNIPELTIIACERDEWRLLTHECRVVDLSEIERLYTTFAGISGEDFLLPNVQDACQRILDLYRGDFLEDYVEDIVRAGGDAWVDSWIREPYTAYRDKYFLALWYRAEFWRVKGYLCNNTSQAEHALQRNWYEMAAQLYRRYALHVPTNFTNESAMFFDLKIKQRISQGERALRASLDMYTATENTQVGDVTYRTFVERMEILTQGRWKPQPNTVYAWNKLKERARSHRPASGVNPHELTGEENGSPTDAHVLP